MHNAAAPGLGQACAVVALSTDATGANRETVENVAKRLAMHVVAASPMYLSPATVSPRTHQNTANQLLEAGFAGCRSDLGHDACGLMRIFVCD